MLRLATVGSGMIVSLFLKGLSGVSGIIHTAVYSRTRERGETFAAEQGLPLSAVWTDMKALAESNTIDAVYIATPNRFHAEQAELFLKNGIHVLCEKPATVTPEQLIRLQTIASKKGVIFMEAIMAPHQPRFSVLKDEITKIGRLSGAQLNFSQYSSRYPAYLEGRTPNIFNPSLCAGALMDIGVYCVNLAIALFGVPDRIEASAHFLSTGADGAGSALFVYPWGDCQMNWSKAAQSRIPSEILGDSGAVTFSPVSRILEMLRWNSEGDANLLFGQEPHEVSLANEARDFVRFILDPVGTKEEYEHFAALSRESAKAMETIRRLSGIRFPAQ